MLNPVVKWGVAAAAMVWAGAAGAAQLNGSIAFGSTGILPDPGALDTVTTFNAPGNAIYGVSSGDFNALTNNNTSFGSVVFSSPINVPISGTASSVPALTITGTGTPGSSFGMFTASTVQVVTREAGFLDLYFLGSYTPAFGNFNADEAASLRLGLTRTGGSVSVSATLAAPPGGVTPPTGVPEPASMAVLGAGLLGLGLARRRKAN